MIILLKLIQPIPLTILSESSPLVILVTSFPLNSKIFIPLAKPPRIAAFLDSKLRNRAVIIMRLCDLLKEEIFSKLIIQIV